MHIFSKNMEFSFCSYQVFQVIKKNFFLYLLSFPYGILINSRVDNYIIIRHARVITLDVLFS